MAQRIRYVGCLPISFPFLSLAAIFRPQRKRRKNDRPTGIEPRSACKLQFSECGMVGWGKTGLRATPTPTSSPSLSRTTCAASLQHPDQKNIVVSCDVLFCALHIHIQALKPHFLFVSLLIPILSFSTYTIISYILSYTADSSEHRPT
jgi:hypothetical protein